MAEINKFSPTFRYLLRLIAVVVPLGVTAAEVDQVMYSGPFATEEDARRVVQQLIDLATKKHKIPIEEILNRVK